MKKITTLMVCGLLGVATLPAQANDLTNLLGEANREATNMLEGVNSQAADNPITSLLSKGLDVNDKQAAGGAGAMLAMAYQTLGESQSSELLKMVPGMDSLTGMIPAGLGSNLANMESVDKVFSLLGMDAGMVQQFAPVIIKYLTGQGASESLLSGLTSAWGVK